MISRIQIFFFLIIFLISNASASAWLGPFEIQNEEFFDCDWSIANKHGNPVKDMKSSGHIRAWIDIIGFRNESIIDGVRYVNGSAKDFAIVKRDAWHTSVDGMVVSFISAYNIGDSNNTTTATQSTTFHWKYEVCGLLGCHWVHVHEYLTVSYTADSPEKFNNSIDDYEITITSYNNSITPYTLIYVPDRDNIIKAVVEYNNSRYIFYNRTGWVSANTKGTEHVEFINKTWDVHDKSHTITRRVRYNVINEAPLNWSQLNISVYTPYIEKDDCEWNVTVVNSKPSDFISWKLILVFILTIMVFVIGGYVAIKGGKR